MWVATRRANLVRYVPSGTYFARLRVGGKLIQKSLGTDKLTVAEMRLGDFERAEKKKAATLTGATKGKLTFGQALQIYRDRGFRAVRALSRKSLVRLKPRSIEYYEQRVVALEKIWPGLGKTDISKITVTDCQKWAARCHADDWSGSSFNHTLGLVRQVFEVAIDAGARYDNPALSVPRESERNKKPELIPTEKFEPFVQAIENAGSGKSRPCAELVRFLAYTGVRKGEAAAVTWADCDFEKGLIRVKGDAETGLKGRAVGDYRLVPMIPELSKMLTRIRAERAEEKPDASVMRVRECQKAMNRAAQALGLPRPTHHTLRHLFATRCIESGVAIPTVAHWLGHKDGGALAMKVYGHLTDHHSISMAQKVSFGAA